MGGANCVVAKISEWGQGQTKHDLGWGAFTHAAHEGHVYMYIFATMCVMMHCVDIANL